MESPASAESWEPAALSSAEAQETAAVSATESQKSGAFSLRLPLVVVIAYWIVYVASGFVVSHMWPRFLLRFGVTLVAGLVVTIWWLRTKRFSRRARWGIVGLVFAAGIAATLLLDHTVLPPVVYMWSIPLAMTLGVIWLALSRNGTTAIQLGGLAAAILLAWTPGLLVRMEGLRGDGTNDVHWRWSTSAEEKFLEQLPETQVAAVAGDEPLELSEGDWFQFRGPAGDSRATELVIATDWEKSPPKQVWKHAIGPAWSSVIVIGDRLFTQEQRGEIEVLTCYSAETGEQLWAHETKDRFEEPLGGVGPRATPAFANGRIYAFSARGRLDCVDARTGELQWSVDALEENDGRLPMWGYSVSPVVVQGKVVVFTGGEEKQGLVAYDAESGKKVWTADAGVESYSSPIALTIHGVEQVLYLGDKKLVSVTPDSGELLWEYIPAAGMNRPTCQPQLVGDDRLLVSFNPQELQQLRVDHAEGEWSVEQVWVTGDLKPDFSDYLVHDETVYGFDGDIYCAIDLDEGKRQWKKGRYGAGQALLLPKMGAVLICTEQGQLVLLKCTPEKHVELARFPAIEGKTWNHQAICRGCLYLRNAEEIACYQLPVEPPTLARVVRP